MSDSYIPTRPVTVVNVSRIVTCHYHEFGAGFVFEGERHNFWEMVYVDKGSVLIGREDEETVLSQGELTFHPPNEFHAVKSHSSSPNFFVISFECSSPAMRYFENFRRRLDKTLKSHLAPLMSEAEKNYRIKGNDPKKNRLERRESRPFGGEQLVKIGLEQFLIYLLRAETDKEDITLLPEKAGEKNPLIAAVLAFMGDRVEDNLRISDLCYEFGCSRSFLTRLFQQDTGESPAAHFTKLKIDRAKELIRETELNFSQISQRLSFENPQYFSRVFRRLTGMTPTEFKNRAMI
ncbi:MAG: AraC family transcriptional regulator [Clostridia bacterium]|nr:AraC family transcriptional regulator [Clostridia bacterium]